jgi:methanogenic corrinoid protein MtbC1
MKRSVQEPQPVSDAAVNTFEQSFPKILALVNEKYALETKYLDREVSSEQMSMLKDAHKRFGEFLLAIYEFHLYENLFNEFSWYVSVFSCRGFKKDYFDTIIKTWNIAIHSVVKPPESHELARPLEWMHQNLSLIFGRCDDPEIQLSEELKKFLAFLITKKRKAATDYILSLLKEGFTIEKLYSDLLPTILREIGRRWQKNVMSVVDVHIATDICRYTIMRLADSIPTELALGYKALVTCVPGEEHETGAELIENYLEIKGWEICSMGHIAPQEDIIQAIDANKPDVVLLSVTLVANLPTAKALTIKIRASESKVKIVMGGHAAMLARDRLKDYADIIVDSIEETHIHSLNLVDTHA